MPAAGAGPARRTLRSGAAACWPPGQGCILGQTLVRRGPDLGALTTSDPPVAPTAGVGMDESRALQRAGWAGAASVVLLPVGVALGYLVGVDDPGMSDAAILERLNDDARQV